MKKAGERFLTVLLAGVFLLGMFLLIGCSYEENEELLYNDYPTDYDPNIDSWEQISEEDKNTPVEITWFSNYSYTSNESTVNQIYEKTGVRVNFVSAADDRNTELNKWIADNDLPDVIALGDEATIAQLAEEGYVYKINKLAESYAPSMLKRIPQDMYDYYTDPDGDMYGLGHSFYSDEDMEEYESLGVHQYTSYDVLVKKNYLDAYIAEMKRQDPSFDENSITKASNFIAMCEWVKQKYAIPNTKPTVMMFNIDSSARNDIYNYTLEALMDFFCVPREDAEGNYVYRPNTEEFKEVMYFLNDLYTKRLICPANINYTLSNIQTNVQKGEPFAIIGTGQQLINHMRILECNGYNAETETVADANQYVSILLTNEEGDAPLITDYSVKGRYTIMISNNCQRVDRVIKVFDYLLSEEGQRDLWYGSEEGKYFNVVVQPGENYPGTDIPSKYGVIEWTDEAEAIIQNNNAATMYAVGIHRSTPITNQIYKRMTSAETNYSGVTNLASWLEYKMKATYFDYSYSQFPFRFPIDRSDRNALYDYLDAQADIDNIWIEYFPKIIMADNNEAALSVYETALNKAKEKGMEDFIAFRNKNFKAYKQKIGIDYAWPMADPGYEAPQVTLYGSFDEYIFDVPATVAWKL